MDPLASLAGKLLGAIAGAVIALVFAPPSNLRKFAFRASGSVIVGIIFGPIAAVYLPGVLDIAWPTGMEGTVAAAAAAAILAWPVMVVLTSRLGDRGREPPGE